MTPVGVRYGGEPRLQLKDEAAAHIRELIVSGQAQPGELLRLAPLAELIGASVTPVREALIILAQDGWVVQEPNRGFRVAAVTRQDIEDAYLVQAFVAGELAARAASIITEEELATLRTLDAAINAHDGKDPGYLESVNYQLHDAVYAAARSDRLVWFVRSTARFVPRRFWGAIPGWLDHNRTGHADLLDALERHDPEGARIAMSRHIHAAGTLLVTYLDSIGLWRD